MERTGFRWAEISRCVLTHSDSNSIFLVAGSSFAILNLRTCPARMDSGLASSVVGPLFQRACSIEPKDERLGCDEDDDAAGGAFLSSVAGCSTFAGRSAGIRHVATTPSPNSTRALPPETSVMRPVT